MELKILTGHGHAVQTVGQLVDRTKVPAVLRKLDQKLDVPVEG